VGARHYCLLLACLSGMADAKRTIRRRAIPPGPNATGLRPIRILQTYPGAATDIIGSHISRNYTDHVRRQTRPRHPIAGAAALGLCVRDRICSARFAHVSHNRCGGCTKRERRDKLGSQVMPTWIGYACFPGAAPAPPSRDASPGITPASGSARCRQRQPQREYGSSLDALRAR